MDPSGALTVISHAHVVTMDAADREWADAMVVLRDNRIVAVGDAHEVDTAAWPDAVHVDGRGCVLTPGLVNTHHHLYQWITRGLAADHTLFEWLTTLYPVWAGIDAAGVNAAARGALGVLATSGCTTSTDHHYVFPVGAGDLLAAEIEAAAAVGLRFHPTRGSMDLGRSDGGLPPDAVVESIDDILTASADAVSRWHDPSPDAMLRIGLAPCSPFSVTSDLLVASAALARDLGVRLHTHLAETEDETAFCAERFGCTPLQYMERLDWLGDDVWFAHGVHFTDDAIADLARTGTAIAHCPTSNARLGAGVARTRDLVAAGVPVGLGVDGAASNESCRMLEEAHMAVMMARAVGGPTALTTRQSLRLATMGGARVLGRDAELGSIETGKLADLVLWDLTTLAHSGIDDPVAALVLGAQPPIRRSWVDGRVVVADGHCTTVDAETVARDVAWAHRHLLARADR
ncbi:hydroxydechloroatrazine ethylaminohydrolase [Williamsia sp. Leaf354]|jgi:cytosine/adenosine deaminase-related metal-dependent hydrolase|uniref:8-oxoguanine deaminase n=1 Tax=Williamsia sp. Leaf354 TaxID=1736349 RepID=UPI0006FA2F80|nr:8-oxoguanine deaminase [Williamsia sp. Leaf354]KQR96561.1 hydroxydechloroatrazine ethylaminohydrolase [Williamsia sp. Leaf354]